jgi:hypothetical protein
METPNRTTPTPTSTTKLQQTVHKCDVAAAHLGNDVIILGCTITYSHSTFPNAPYATTPFEIGGNFKPDENSVLIAAVPDTKTGINQTLTVPNPDFVRSHRKYRDRYVVIVIINKY